MSNTTLERAPLAFIGLAYLTGIILNHVIDLGPAIWFGLLLSGFLFSLIKPNQARSLIVMSLLCFLLGGMNHACRTDITPNHLSQFEFSDEPDSIFASVEQSEIKSNGSQKVRLIQVYLKHPEWEKYDGKLLLTIKNSPVDLKYGDLVRFASRINQPASPRNPGEFDYKTYLANHHIFATAYLESGMMLSVAQNENFSPHRIANIAKMKVEDLIDKSMTGKPNAVLKALIVGMRGEVSDEVVQNFVDTGVIHVLAVSGLHVGYVTLVILLILGFMRIPRKAKMIITIGGLIFYALMVDLRPSVNRAVIMAVMLLIAQGWEKRVNVYNTIAIAALIQTLCDPLQLFDMGFQLSFMAVLSIVYIYKRLEFFLPPKLKPANITNSFLRSVWQLFLVSVSAQLGTLPITIYYFQRIPLISMVANLFVVPLVGLIGGLGFGQVILGFIWQGFNLVYGEVQMLLIGLLLKIVELSARVPMAYLSVPTISLLGLYGGYLALLLLLNLDKQAIRKATALGLLIGLNVWTWSAIFVKPVLQITYLDVGQGDAIFVEFPNRKTLLIDTGDRTFRRDYGEFTVAPFLKRKGVRRLDYLELSHPHNDHIGGAPFLMRHFRIGEVWEPDVTARSQVYREIHMLADSLQIPVRRLYAGDCIHLAESLKIFILHPSKLFLANPPHGFNDYSNVIKISYRRTNFLFCGDAEKHSEDYLCLWRSFLQANVLKVPHHGSATSSSQPFIEMVAPDIAVVSVGKNNKFRHPSISTMARYESLGIIIHRTDLERALIIESDGRKYHIKRW